MMELMVMTDEKADDKCSTQPSQANLASSRNHHSSQGEIPMLKERVTMGLDQKIPIHLTRSVKSFQAFLTVATPEKRRERDNLLKQFIQCEIKNVIATEGDIIKIYCPCCGCRIKKINRNRLFINEPSGIFLMFCKVKCKQAFLDDYLEDPTLDRATEFVARTPQNIPTIQDKKEKFYRDLHDFLEAL